jgi:hypothetical protein
MDEHDYSLLEAQIKALPRKEQIRHLRRAAENLRKGEGEEAASIKPEYHQLVADIINDLADSIEAGEDPFEEEEESPERFKADAEVAQQMSDLLKRYDAGSLGTLLKRYGTKVEDLG